MPDEPTQEQILAAMVDRCTAITVGNGYHSTVAQVSRRLLGLEQLAAMPAVLVLLGPDTADPQEIGLGGAIEDILEVAVVLYHDADPTAFLRLRADVERAITTPDLDLGLGSDIVQDVARLRGDPPEEFLSDAWSRMGAVDWYRVRYAYPKGAP